MFYAFMFISQQKPSTVVAGFMGQIYSYISQESQFRLLHRYRGVSVATLCALLRWPTAFALATILLCDTISILAFK